MVGTLAVVMVMVARAFREALVLLGTSFAAVIADRPIGSIMGERVGHRLELPHGVRRRGG